MVPLFLINLCPLQNRRQAAVEQFNNHIVVCVLSQPNSQIIGLASLVLPLRSSNIAIEDLHDVVLLGDVNFLEKEWPYLYNLPKIHVVKVMQVFVVHSMFSWKNMTTRYNSPLIFVG